MTIFLWHQEDCGEIYSYYKDEINDSAIEINNDCNNDKTIRRKYFEYKKKIIGSTPNDSNTLNPEIVVPLKYLSNLWRFLDLPLSAVK